VNDWWGRYAFELGARRHWRIGSLSLWITRLEHEWQVAHCWSDDPFDGSLEIARDDVEPPAELMPRRYLFTGNPSHLILTPRVADRPVVTRPELPLIIPGGESATIYMASPLWVEFAVELAGQSGKPDKPPPSFAELPVWRASRTWFGDNTLEGTLCYAARTRARVEPGDVRGPRITTAVRVSNEHGEPLQVERLALPLPQMSVFRDAQGQLWTEAASVPYAGVGTGPARIESAAPREAGPVSLVSRPRQDRQTNLLARAISAALRGVIS
jgi:hypothetical protein